jgi:hypothetical protein
MHCTACDRNLSDFESTRKDENTGQYLDLCNTCYKASGIGNVVPVAERFDLAHEDDVDVEEIDSVLIVDYEYRE